MAIRFFVLACCIVVARAGVIAPAAQVAAVAHVEEVDPHPQYTFSYDVQDAISGDSKHQVETRDGGIVQGQYSLNDADGYRRIVDYTSDPLNGFNAVVRREPLVAAPALVKSIPSATVLAAPASIRAVPTHYAPTLIRTAPAPLAVASPLTYAAYSPTLVKTALASPVISYAH